MKTVFCCLLTALTGLAAGLLIGLALSPPGPEPPHRSTADRNPEASLAAEGPAAALDRTAPSSRQEALLARAYQALYACQRHDFTALAACVHPVKGVTFTPYSTVDDANLTFSAAELAQARQDDTVYIWGVEDGSSLPIQRTISDYFDRYVCNAAYTQAPILGVDQVISSGNSLENVQEAYPDGHFVEFYFPGASASAGGVDWCGLKLVFEEYQSEYWLMGMIHSEWTV